MADAERNWQELSEKAKEAQILEGLIDIDLQRADPHFSRQYTEAKVQITDAAERLRLDNQMFDRVAELREEGRMLTVEELMPRAKEMVGLSSVKLRKAFSDFSRELRQQS